jgi:hypothetical protein
MDVLKEKGWARLNVGRPDTYAPHAEGNFLTPSGCEFKASMAAGGYFVLMFDASRFSKPPRGR